MFDRICENDRDWDDDLLGAKYIARNPGCGCCSSWEKLTSTNLEQYIAELESRLVEAKTIRNNL